MVLKEAMSPAVQALDQDDNALESMVMELHAFGTFVAAVHATVASMLEGLAAVSHTPRRQRPVGSEVSSILAQAPQTLLDKLAIAGEVARPSGMDLGRVTGRFDEAEPLVLDLRGLVDERKHLIDRASHACAVCDNAKATKGKCDVEVQAITSRLGGSRPKHFSLKEKSSRLKARSDAEETLRRNTACAVSALELALREAAAAKNDMLTRLCRVYVILFEGGHFLTYALSGLVDPAMILPMSTRLPMILGRAGAACCADTWLSKPSALLGQFQDHVLCCKREERAITRTASDIVVSGRRYDSPVL